MRHLLSITMMLFFTGIFITPTSAKSIIQCVEKVVNGKRVRYVFNKHRTKCIQYTKGDEITNQKRLLRLQDYMKNKEPIWKKKEKKHIAIQARYKAEKKGWEKIEKHLIGNAKDANKKANNWKKAFFHVKKLKAPPKVRLWENPWFWSTTLIVTAVSVGLIAYFVNVGKATVIKSSLIQTKRNPRIFRPQNLPSFTITPPRINTFTIIQ